MLGAIFWLVILIFFVVCFVKGGKQDVESHNDCADKFIDHVQNGNSYSFDDNAGIYSDWRGRPRDVVTGKVAARHHDFESGEEWVVDIKGNFLRNISEQEWKRKEIEGINRGEDLVLVDENRGHGYKRFNYVEGRIYKDIKSGKYCVIREFCESFDGYCKRRDYDKNKYSSEKAQWLANREWYTIVIDVVNGHFVRFKDKGFMPASIFPLEPRIEAFNNAMDKEWFTQVDGKNKIVAGRKFKERGIKSRDFEVVYF